VTFLNVSRSHWVSVQHWSPSIDLDGSSLTDQSYFIIPVQDLSRLDEVVGSVVVNDLNSFLLPACWNLQGAVQSPKSSRHSWISYFVQFLHARTSAYVRKCFYREKCHLRIDVKVVFTPMFIFLYFLDSRLYTPIHRILIRARR